MTQEKGLFRIILNRFFFHPPAGWNLWHQNREKTAICAFPENRRGNGRYS